MTTISLAPPLRTRHAHAPQPDALQPSGLGRTARIQTLVGWLPVERLMAGDLVLDRVGNLHELRGLRQRRVHGASVVRIGRAGRAPLVVGSGQRLESEDWRARVIFGQATACAAARMVDGVAIRRGQPRGTVLFDLQFDSVVCLDVGGAKAVFTPAL